MYFIIQSEGTMLDWDETIGQVKRLGIFHHITYATEQARGFSSI